MSIIIDLVIVIIFCICIGIGYKRGLTGSLLKIISFILALVIAFILFKPISNFIIDNTNWDENLEQAIRQMVIEQEETKDNETQNIENQNTQGNNENNNTNNENTKQSMPTVIMDYINQTVENAGTEAKNAIVDSTARNVAVTIINAGVLIALFLISRIVLLLIRGLAELLTNLPIIKQFDKLGGIIYGLLEALIIIYVILAIMSFISPLIAETGIMDAIQKSFLGLNMYNNNLLLKIIF